PSWINSSRPKAKRQSGEFKFKWNSEFDLSVTKGLSMSLYQLLDCSGPNSNDCQGDPGTSWEQDSGK
ncbi:MAG: hypothetical protein EBU26_15805, partial [Verrucomicrobia bacterium]|nr:hypothetical protein [Verrucomicrobiota bacterium]